MFHLTRQKLFGMLAILMLVILTVDNSAPSTTVMAQATQTATPVAKKSLAEQVGFSDPELDRLEAEGIYKLGDSLEITAYGHRYRLLTVLWEIELVAPGGIALLYQIDGAKPILRWGHDYLKDGGYSPFIINNEAPPPGEWNRDGKIFFAVRGAFVGTAWYHSLYFVYEIRPDGKVVSHLKGIIPPGAIVVKIERQPVNDKLLLTVLDSRGSILGFPRCCGPQIFRYYEWRNNKLFDASMYRASEYQADLERTMVALAMGSVTSIEEAVPYAANLMQLLMIYEAIDQREAGWQLAQNLVAQARNSRRLVEGTYIDLVFMPTMARLFKENKPFIAPEYANSKGGPNDFYADDPS